METYFGLRSYLLVYSSMFVALGQDRQIRANMTVRRRLKY